MADRPDIPPAGGGFRGVPPLTPGHKTSDELTQQEKASLESAFGVSSQDQGKILQAASVPELPEDFKVKPRKKVDISTLPPEQQREYQAILKEAEERFAAIAAENAAKKKAEVPVPPITEPDLPIPEETGNAVPFPLPTPAPLAKDPPIPVAEPAVEPVEDSSTEKAIRLCPNCSWNQDETDVVPIDDIDKKMWLRHILSGDRFIKQYSLFGNQVTLTLRSRRVAEQDMISDQLDIDQKKGRFESPISMQMWLYWLNRYSLAVSMSEILYKNGQKISFPEVIISEGTVLYSEETKERFEGETPVYYINKVVFGAWSDVLYNAILGYQQRFDQLCGRLQSLAWDTDFFGKAAGLA